MTKTIQFKLKPTKEQEALLDRTLNLYINAVNSTLSDFLDAGHVLNYTSKDVQCSLPSALKNQCVKDAKVLLKKYKKRLYEVALWNNKHTLKETKVAKVPIAKRPNAIWNNQNFTVLSDGISIPMWTHKSQRIIIKALMTDDIKKSLEGTLGALRITKKSGKYIAQVSVEIDKPGAVTGQVMGVDIGIKVPAVCATESGKIRFFGKGRKNKYIRRQFKSKRHKLGKAKKLDAIRKLNNKEERVMRDIDHKISRQIINYALKNKVSLIRLEELAGIRNTTRTSRKNNHSLHNWSFYRLIGFITYKAALVGIRVELVNPAYTSQECPDCRKRNHTKGRSYKCSCGFKSHRDVVGAINITMAKVKTLKVSRVDGNSLSA